MKEASRESQRKYHGVKGETLAEVFKSVDRREQVTGELVDRLCLGVLRTSYPEIPEEDHPWMLEHVREDAHLFIQEFPWQYFKELAEYRKNHHGKTYDENILIPAIMRAAKVI